MPRRGPPTTPSSHPQIRSADNQAATVAPGDQKPTSAHELERVDDSLRVVAHLSEGMDRYNLDDAEMLRQFVQAELTYGLRSAIENQVLTGDGTGQNMTGLLEIDGTTDVAFSDNVITTARHAVTTAQGLGSFTGRADGGVWTFVMSPATWQAVESTTADDGQYLSGPSVQHGIPIGRAPGQLWGHQTVVTPQMSDDEALFINTGAIALYRDNGTRVDWSEAVGDDFQRNQIRCRVETRCNLAVYQPSMVVRFPTAGEGTGD